ncbi:unnamed protein product [Rotaria sp. Silwood2]|nr:unnamed protein product [Rotaria sp. Silwood2]CAF4514167.1 unnamed protein product [Rotaria sp. Silwood2]CAF4525479.1 unnamed protein product [Rotaria sp. Silwood2]
MSHHSCVSLKVILYRGLPVFYLLIATAEAILAFARLLSLSGGSNLIRDNAQVGAGFVLDCISSGTAILTGILIYVSLAIFVLSCICVICTGKRSGTCCSQQICQPAILRFVTLNCNFPFYVTRPKNRFRHRMIFLVSSSILRLVAVIIYATVKSGDIDGRQSQVALLCGISVLCPLCMILLDIFRYRIWWHYRPSCDDDRSYQRLSPKHVRFLPYHLLGDNRSMIVPGNQPCINQNTCTKRELEHIMIFHSSKYKPQLRWTELSNSDREKGIYVGFHCTTPEAAVSIAHSDFRINNKPPQMLGFGVYFARSIKGTERKARHSGATICAEVQMGKVKEVTWSQLYTVSNSRRWWKDYDTVYYVHANPNRDEFCVKDPSQILRWVIVVNEAYDANVQRFRLNHEFENTQCGWV